jgi:hypothetical protein
MALPVDVVVVIGAVVEVGAGVVEDGGAVDIVVEDMVVVAAVVVDVLVDDAAKDVVGVVDFVGVVVNVEVTVVAAGATWTYARSLPRPFP